MATEAKMSPGGAVSSRRELLRQGLAAAGVLAVGGGLARCGLQGSSSDAGSPELVGPMSNIPGLAGSLREINVVNDLATRMWVPRGFNVREVARTGQRACKSSDYVWHRRPDGGATYPTEDGGWIYVSNSEVSQKGQGGAGALRFDSEGEVVDSYSIVTGTTNNCAGGPTPWGTWLSCEEVDDGLVYECDPAGAAPAVALPALGRFKHEAAAVDPVERCIYLTEDTPDSNFYRFRPDYYPHGGRADLSSGTLEVAVIRSESPHLSRAVSWAPVPEPMPRLGGPETHRQPPTRKQVPGAAVFNGGEGCWYHAGIVYFTTKGDNRVWAYDTVAASLDLIYDKESQAGFTPGLDDVDNLTISASGDILVAEDGAEMRIVVLGNEGQPFELVKVLGHRGSEICGPAFSPDGSRLYFSSQKGPSGSDEDGRVYEMRGPFFS